jgi:dienelactone hydrolase
VMRTRLLDALAMLKGLPAVDTARLAAIGFCLGGKCVRAVARLDVNSLSINPVARRRQ